MQYAIDIAVNLIANLIGWLIVVGFGIFAVAFRARKRRRLMKFLGLSGEQSRLSVYLSALELSVQVKNLYDQEQRWQGTALSAVEFEVIPSIDRWLQQINKSSDSFIDGLLDYLTPAFLKLPEIHLQYLPSPRTVDDLILRNHTIIVVGGTAHNALAKFYSEKNMMVMETDDSQQAIRIDHGKHAGRIFRPTRQRASDGEYETEVAKVERIVDSTRSTVSFVAEGVSTNGTLAAVHYLIANWERLCSVHRDQPFAICIECPTWKVDKMGYMNSSVILDLSANEMKLS